ncbi:flagellar assembly factor FliW [Natronincola peptidivorans]|uniref:Flagellar assembly factor FliW n=1 Tax=Natronincola peptidivorans TaxID=426128 RepID=A0A1H9ZRG8_9FIRM|nr:flagellar assembly protein FliW [Natronincola peptidivorans]SES84357.1 flagellar assembly factor FliW [Natronincola peptidivorans]
MLLNTKHFGEINIEEEKTLHFPDGLPGFEKLTKFIILQNPDEGVPFHWLQSTEEGELAFVIVNPFIFIADYDFEISQRTIEKLDIQTPEDVSIFTIVIVPEDINKMTANLRAPIIINTKNNKAKQIVLDDDKYHAKHYIIEELKKASQEKIVEEAK